MREVRILGPFPPPFGGVAIHCIRLLEALREKGLIARGVSLGGVPQGVDNVSTWKPWMLLSRTPVHYHTDEGNHRWMRLFSAFWRFTRTPYVVSVHSFRDRSELRNERTLRSLAAAFRHARAVIAISSDVADALEKTLGFRHTHTYVIPSTLPISEWELSAELPQSVAETWRRAPIRILANAGRVVLYNGRDLYGLDVLLDAFQLIDNPNVELCIAVGDVVDEALWRSHSERMKTDPRITLVRDLNSPLTPLVKQANIVVRPTLTEGGASLTITEALELGKWAIGSDSVSRPQGCILFRTGDHVDLVRALEEVITRVQNNDTPPQTRDSAGIAQLIIETYRAAELVP